MNVVPLILLGMAGAFFIVLGGKERLERLLQIKVCVICATVSATWLLLLGLYAFDMFQNHVFLALLMGQSITGLLYLGEAKVPASLQVFRLPFLLSVTVLAYILIVGIVGNVASVAVVLALWAGFGGMYSMKNKNMRAAVEKIVACCKRW